MHEEFQDEQDIKDVTEKALSLKLSKDDDIMQFVDKASKTYNDAEFTDEQELAIPSKSASSKTRFKGLQ